MILPVSTKCYDQVINFDIVIPDFKLCLAVIHFNKKVSKFVYPKESL